MERNYCTYKEIFKKETFPLAYIDMEMLDANVKILTERANRGTIRIASKSVRSIEILKYLFRKSNKFKGIMSFTVLESLFLVKQGFDDILLGYPCVDKNLISQIADVILKNKTIVLMVDKIEHVALINAVGKEKKVQLPICIDLDCSSDFGPIHFGVWRSSITNNQQLQKLLNSIKKSHFVKLDGLMGYEAQIAGLGDNVKGDTIKNLMIKILKNRSISKIRKRRTAAINLIKKNGFDLRFINGGGTGSIKETLEEKEITEITIGSGFYNPHLFDNYRDFQLNPSAGFAIQIVRNPKENYYTCHGGGYIASGSIDKLKAPKIDLLEGARFVANEGCGEVQTPIVYKGKEHLKIGDPVFLRHAKAGELCERFNEIYRIRNHKIIDKVTTYRGDGFAFL
ncbi:conserved hypothetical protein [Tenacibaculum maritimum]|uniref:alanine racemase n=1 Tax=Tenacibaculum maritimum TaxID=107401 RepID=UPI0012E4916D|nr:alanine racemase [Tenacibaculum maritimum]CAA0182990.1 conserved hypothetical protein [Tenacibaculum maritimum]